LEYIPWSADSEAHSIGGIDIGLMPLLNNPWCLGKCSYKMLLYMSCGIPVVVSNFGMNSEILKKTRAGVGVISADDWGDAIEHLIHHPNDRIAMGEAGRQAVVTQYSVGVAAKSWHAVLSEFG
jgi:glycosyltransferase involved in cell wall biosynthesis